DHSEHISLYFNKECEVLCPLMEKKTWKITYSTMYARKVTGVISYVFNTKLNCNVDNTMKIISSFIENTPFLEDLTIRDWAKLTNSFPKYAVVLFLSVNRKYKLLISMCNLKTKINAKSRNFDVLSFDAFNR